MLHTLFSLYQFPVLELSRGIFLDCSEVLARSTTYFSHLNSIHLFPIVGLLRYFDILPSFCGTAKQFESKLKARNFNSSSLHFTSGEPERKDAKNCRRRKSSEQKAAHWKVVGQCNTQLFVGFTNQAQDFLHDVG